MGGRLDRGAEKSGDKGLRELGQMREKSTEFSQVSLTVKKCSGRGSNPAARFDHWLFEDGGGGTKVRTSRHLPLAVVEASIESEVAESKRIESKGTTAYTLCSSEARTR